MDKNIICRNRVVTAWFLPIYTSIFFFYIATPKNVDPFYSMRVKMVKK